MHTLRGCLTFFKGLGCLLKHIVRIFEKGAVGLALNGIVYRDSLLTSWCLHHECLLQADFHSPLLYHSLILVQVRR